MRMSASVKAAAVMLGAVALVALGSRAFSVLSLRGYKPSRVEPGEFAIVAFAPGSGYRIIVSNGIAHLAEVRDDGEGGFETPSDDQREIEDAPRLPMRETLATLRGDVQALSHLVMSVNRLETNEIPTDPVVWRAEDIERAVGGDAALRSRLERDLQTTLEGMPLAVVSRTAVNKGIVVDSPVKVRFSADGQAQELTCRIQEPFVTRFVDAVQVRLSQKFDQPDSLVAGIYREEALRIQADPAQAEDVARALRARYDPERLEGFASKPARVLSACRVLVNESHLTGADSACRAGDDGRDDCSITLGLTEDGRMRLWKYSHDRKGFQLLVTVRGVAVAAPRIRTELSSREVKLTQLTSRSLVQETIDLVREVVGPRKQS
jgi:hypothetical protein